jgi:hypothetical protein
MVIVVLLELIVSVALEKVKLPTVKELPTLVIFGCALLVTVWAVLAANTTNVLTLDQNLVPSVLPVNT